MHPRDSLSTAALRALGPRERIAAIADPGSVRPVDASFDAPRPSPHLARWGIAARDDDGVVVARGTVDGAHVLVAAQDDRFLGGSTGANHADTLRGLFERAKVERPAAVVLLAASGGVRLHEANAAEWALARALTALLDLRAAGVAVIAVGVGDVFGGASVLVCAAERTALVPGVRLGLSGPAVVATARERAAQDAIDAAALAAMLDAVFGAQARAAAGHVDELPDGVGAIRRFIARGIAESMPFARWVDSLQERLTARLTTDVPIGGAVEPPPLAPLPSNLSSLYATAQSVDATGWLSRLGAAPVWLCRPLGSGSFGPFEANALDASLLANFPPGGPDRKATLVLLGDSEGHEVSLRAEALCVSQYLAQHAAVLALLRARGVRVRGLLTGVGHSAEFFTHVLQAPEIGAFANARVVAMEPAAIARVTRLPERELAALIERDALLGHPVRHFAQWAGIADLLPETDLERVLGFVEERAPRA
jgi:malonate decarboxylase beta subunit